jgi:colanic acid biosynthesis glycosyl transferase WcaI
MRRILAQTLNYAPDEIGIPKYSTETADFLGQSNFAVRVVTAPPYYPRWQVNDGYRAWWYQRDHHNGIPLLRCPLYVPEKVTGAKRMLHLGSYGVSSAAPVLWQALRHRPHAMFATAPALTAAPATAVAARAVGAVSFLHVQDFEIDIALQMGLLKGGRAASLLQAFERWVLRQFSYVSAPSPAMVRRLVEKGCAPERTFLFRNWGDTKAIHPRVDGRRWRARHGIADHEAVVLYSGNLAEKQGVFILIEAAREMQHKTSMRLVICGEGPTKAQLLNRAQGLNNVTILPLQPAADLPELLAAADIHVLPQLPEADNLVLPSKLSGMLASGRPVVATVGPSSGIADEIAGGGRIVPPGDHQALAQALIALGEDATQRNALGARARQQAERNWDKEVILSGFMERVHGAIDENEQRLGRRPSRIVPSYALDTGSVSSRDEAA